MDCEHAARALSAGASRRSAANGAHRSRPGWERARGTLACARRSAEARSAARSSAAHVPSSLRPSASQAAIAAAVAKAAVCETGLRRGSSSASAERIYYLGATHAGYDVLRTVQPPCDQIPTRRAVLRPAVASWLRAVFAALARQARSRACELVVGVAATRPTRAFFATSVASWLRAVVAALTRQA